MMQTRSAHRRDRLEQKYRAISSAVNSGNVRRVVDCIQGLTGVELSVVSEKLEPVRSACGSPASSVGVTLNETPRLCRTA